MIRARWYFTAVTLLVGCSPSETSISLIFPNEVAKATTRRLQINAFNPETNAATATARTCADFNDRARTGSPPVGNPERGDFDCREPTCAANWFAEKVVPEISVGKKIIYVLGFASVEEGATPILEGCNDRFDTDGGGDQYDEVPVELRLVIPDSARLVKSAGDRQVGRSGQPVGVPLQVRVEADAPGGEGGPYVIPGVPITFTSKNPDFRITTGDNAGRYSTFSNTEGTAEIGLMLPVESGQGDIDAEAPALEVTKVPERAKVTFSVSVTDPIDFAVREVINAGAGARPIAAAIGNIIAGGANELAVVSCVGSADGCRPGVVATQPFGTTRLNVYSEIRTSKTNLSVPTDLGILPVGMTVTNLVGAAPDEVVILNSRNTNQSRRCAPNGRCACYRPDRAQEIPCPSEGAEVVTLGASGGGGVSVLSRLTLTGSNAVGLTSIRAPNTQAGQARLVVASQGRAAHTRPCSRANRCLPYLTAQDCIAQGRDSDDCLCQGDPGANCGCPPNERCECLGANCAQIGVPGVCVARDNIIDLVGASGAVVQNVSGCNTPRLWCPNPGVPNTSDGICLDNTDLPVTNKDGCSCAIPAQVQIGDGESAVSPSGIAAGPLRSDDAYDIVVPSTGGLELIQGKGGAPAYAWTGAPIVNSRIHTAIIAQIDPLNGEAADYPADVIWYSRYTCVQGPNFLKQCPLWREFEEADQAKGCLGVFFTAGAASIFDLPSAEVGGCRRHLLDYAPDGMCIGDFNQDGSRDVLTSANSSNTLFIYAGDGRGGLLDPPDTIELPGGAGGPMACGDLDGDGRDDVVVLDLATGTIQILRTSS